MEVYDAIKNRRSIRKYQQRVVEKEKLMKVFETARLSPSAMNHQPYAFVRALGLGTMVKNTGKLTQQLQ